MHYQRIVPFFQLTTSASLIVVGGTHTAIRGLPSSQPEALKGPLAKFNWIGHAIPSERKELPTEGSFQFRVSFEIAERIAGLYHHPGGVECLPQCFDPFGS